MKKLLSIGKYSLIFQKGFRIVLNEQLWFWSDEWQIKEKQVEQDIKDGRVETFEDYESFMNSLKEE
jgi:hypothetical protein